MEIVVPAKPESIRIDLKRTATIIVDMQNAFCSKGGMIDVVGNLNEMKVEHVIKANKKVIDSSRNAGIKIRSRKRVTILIVSRMIKTRITTIQ